MRPSLTGEAALHIVNARSLPRTAQRDEATLEKEQGEGAFQPGFGRKHTKKHQKQRQRVLQQPLLEIHWRTQWAVMSWGKWWKGGRWGAALCWAGLDVLTHLNTAQAQAQLTLQRAQWAQSAHQSLPAGPRQLLMKRSRAAADTTRPGSRNIHGRTSSLPWEWDSLPNTTGCHVPAGQDMAETRLCARSCLFLHCWGKK